jgi:hypothetical protein
MSAGTRQRGRAFRQHSAAALCAAALLLFAAAPLAAQTSMEAFTPGVSGDYVVYRDHSWKNPTWIGFLYYDESTYGAIAVTPSTGSRVTVLFRVETADGTMVLTGQNVTSRASASDDVIAVNYLMALLPDLYAWRQSAVSSRDTVPAGARSALLPPLVRSAMNLPQFGGDVALTWVAEVPLFNLQGIARATGATGTVGAILELARIGRIRSGGEQDFFGFLPAPEPKSGASLAVPAKLKTETRVVDGLSLRLDGQWTMIADNTFLLGNAAALIVDTLDPALLGFAAENLPLSLVRLFSLSSGSSWMDPAELSVSGDAKDFRISNLVYDAETGTANRDIKRCIPSADGKKCAVVSLTVSETAWRANRAYFEAILNTKN